MQTNTASVTRPPSIVKRLKTAASDSISGQVTEESLAACYRYALKLTDSRALDRAMEGAGFDTQERRDFREGLNHSRYVVGDFRRGVMGYFQGRPMREMQTRFGLSPADIKHLQATLDSDDLLVLLKQASTYSLFRLSDRDFQWIIEKAVPATKQVGLRLQRGSVGVVKQYDPAQDPDRDLLVEAVRVTEYYAHLQDPNRILGNVRKAIGFGAGRLMQYHMAAKRARVVSFIHSEEEPAVKVVKTEIVPEASLSATGKTVRSFLTQASGKTPEQRRAGYTKKRDDRPREPARVYQSTTLSMDAPLGEDQTTNLGATFESHVPNPEVQAQASSFLSALLSEDLEPKILHYIRLVCNDDLPESVRDNKFDAWLRKKCIRTDDPQILGRLACQYLELDHADVVRKVGAIMGPLQFFIVRVGDTPETTETDLVVARSSKDAVKYLARHYRFATWRAMQDKCGKVRCKAFAKLNDDKSGQAMLKQMEEGQVVPYDNAP